MPLEVETRYYVSKDVALRALRRAQSELIETHYFPSHEVANLVSDLKIRKSQGDYHLLTTARLRRIENGTVSFCIDFKGRKFAHTHDSTARPEIPPTELSRTQYERYLTRATNGSTVKRRYHIPGLVFTPPGSVPVIAHLDHFLRAGVPLRPLTSEFFTADFEADGAVLAHLRRGKHNFDFLKHAHDLSSLDDDLRNPLRNKRLARKGFDRRLEDALKRLEQLFK
jgi:hypothetical protein